MTKVLVTGANGFVGNRIAECFLASDMQVTCASRGPFSPPEGSQLCVVGDIHAGTDWTSALQDIDVVVHAAARVHVMNDSAKNPLEEFRHVNVEGTLSLARQAARAGIKRFVFLSSIKVNGEQTVTGKPFTADDFPAPTDPYGISKYEAEQGLQNLARETGMEIVIIRPVLVYGPGVRANFLAMMRWLYRGIPLPLGAINNRRSLVALDNLVDLIRICARHPAAANEIFLVSDAHDLSTTELLQGMARALKKKACLISVPASVLKNVVGLLGKKDFAQRLCGSLQVDLSKTKKILDWTPPVSVAQALQETAEYFLKNL